MPRSEPGGILYVVSDKPLVIEAASATFTRVRLPFGLVVASLTVRGLGVEITSKPVAVEIDEPAQFEAIVDGPDIVAFLSKKAPGGLRDFKIRLEDGHVHVNATLRLLVELKASAVCRLVIKDGRQLFVELDSADVLAVGAKSLIKSQIDSINPIFDVEQLPLPCTLESVEIEEGVVKLCGSVSPPIKS